MTQTPAKKPTRATTDRWVDEIMGIEREKAEVPTITTVLDWSDEEIEAAIVKCRQSLAESIQDVRQVTKLLNDASSREAAAFIEMFRIRLDTLVIAQRVRQLEAQLAAKSGLPAEDDQIFEATFKRMGRSGPWHAQTVGAVWQKILRAFGSDNFLQLNERHDAFAKRALLEISNNPELRDRFLATPGVGERYLEILDFVAAQLQEPAAI